MLADSTSVKTKDFNLYKALKVDTLASQQSIDSTKHIDTIDGDSAVYTAEVHQEKVLFNGKPIYPNQDHWISGMLLLGFIILAYLNYNYRRRLSQMIRAVFARNYMNQLIREGNFFKEWASILLALNYALVIPLFIYFSSELLYPIKGISKNMIIFSYIFLIVISLWLFRIILIKINSIVFKTPKPAYEILLYIFISNVFLSLIILPLITIYYYTQLEIFLFFGMGLYLSIYSLRIIREFMIGMSYSIFSVLHLFLYLCSLEIIPVVILFKMISIY